MSERVELYKCTVCGNVIEIVIGIQSNIICCTRKMVKMTENMHAKAPEKHIPIIEKVDGGIRVNVGEVQHPMADNHYIVMIEVLDGNEVYRRFLKFSELPEATFPIEDNNDIVARAYCNLHGLWKSETTPS